MTGLIHWVAGAEGLLFGVLLLLARKCGRTGSAGKGSRDSIKWGFFSALEIGNVVFVTIISIFPLLGMLGTVQSLLSLDMAGDMDGLKNNFFQALDTTKLGIIYAVVYKVLYAFCQVSIEEQIGKGRQIREKINR